MLNTATVGKWVILMSKWEYGGVYKKYNMDGEIKVGNGILKVHNIFEPLPEFMKQADVIFCDPPCSKVNINSFYTKADRTDYQEDYTPFAERFFECIDEIKPKQLFVEVFKSNYDYFLNEMKKRYKHIYVCNSKYYNNNKNKCWIFHGTNDVADMELLKVCEFMDEEKIIEWICANVQFECIGDLCMGRGLVGWNAYRNGKKFVGTELNKKRLAVLVDKIYQAENAKM